MQTLPLAVFTMLLAGGQPLLAQSTQEDIEAEQSPTLEMPDSGVVDEEAAGAEVDDPSDVGVETNFESAADEPGTAPVTDGMIFDDAGNLYFSALEDNAIIYRTPAGAFRTLVQGPEISWPDSFAIDHDAGLLYFSTAMIHRTPGFSPDGTWPGEPFRIWSHPLAE